MAVERGRQVARTTGGVIAIIALVAGMVWFGQRIDANGRPPSAGTLEQRVANQFGRYSTIAAEKFGTSPVPEPYIHVDTVTLADGSHASLWVSNLPADSPVPSRYTYVDVEAANGSFSYSFGGGGGMTDEVTFSSSGGGVLIGQAGTRPAARARIEGEGLSVEARVVCGYFLMAAPPTQSEEPTYTITLLDGAGRVLTVATDVSPPG
jgi:hypothetical protein